MLSAMNKLFSMREATRILYALKAICQEIEMTVPMICGAAASALSNVLNVKSESFSPELHYGYVKALTNDIITEIRHHLEIEQNEEPMDDVCIIANEMWKIDTAVKKLGIQKMRFHEITSVGLERWILHL